jgi:cation diffusion facilitator family transporter
MEEIPGNVTAKLSAIWDRIRSEKLSSNQVNSKLVSAPSNEKTSVALTSVFASGGMAVMKLVVGLMTGSIGILSEAAHSLLDLGAASLTYFAVRVSDKPADETHPYGHAKIESVSALIETGLLFLTSLWIVVEAVDRLRSSDVSVETTWYSVAVIVAAIIIDFFRARALMRVARATKSQALEADALHFSSDILSSSVVLVGLLFVYFGYHKADAFAAIGVAIFVCRAGYALGRRTIDILIDTAPEGVAERVQTLVEPIAGVAKVDRVRVRPAGKTIFIEVLVSVARTLPVPRVQQTSAAITQCVRGEYPDADVVVHTQPLALDNETVADRVRLIADRHGQTAQRIAVQVTQGRLAVSLELEVPGRQNILEAHQTASTLESAIREELGSEVTVDTRIRPMPPEQPEETAEDGSPALHSLIIEEAARIPSLIDVHNVHIRRSAAGRYISMHCRFDDQTPLQRVEQSVRQLEHRLLERIDGVDRIVLHAEPMSDAD